MSLLRFIIFLVLMVQPSGVFAQFDASTSNFVGHKNSKAPIESDYSPGRYKVHDRPLSKDLTPEVRKRDLSGQVEKESQSSTKESSTSASLKPVVKPTPRVKSNSLKSQKASSASMQNSSEESSATTSSQETGNEPVEEQAAEELPPQVKDRYLELSAGVSYVELKSESPTYSRRFNLKTPALHFKGEIWLMPQWGVHFDYSRNASATLEDDSSSGKHVSVSYQSLGLDASWRTPWMSQAIGSVRYEVSAGLFDQNFMPEGSAVNRVNIRTTGVRVTVARVFNVQDFHSKFYFRLSPFNTQSEDGRSGSYKSGELNASSQMTLGLMFGSKLSESWSYYIHPSVTYESTTYKGVSSLDPVSSKTYENTSVNSTLTTLSFGFTWGQ